MAYLLTSGCSHTYGIGLDTGQVWADQLARDLGLDLVNLSRGGANSGYVRRSLEDYLSNVTVKPDLIVVQWPNPFRASRSAANGEEYFVNVTNIDRNLAKDLRDRPWILWEAWMHDIIHINQNWPKIINICLESKDFVGDYIERLRTEHAIDIHIDEKLPDRTWVFDNAAKDGSHHSSTCHRKWADRLCEIVKKSVTM